MKQTPEQQLQELQEQLQAKELANQLLTSELKRVSIMHDAAVDLAIGRTKTAPAPFTPPAQSTTPVPNGLGSGINQKILDYAHGKIESLS